VKAAPVIPGPVRLHSKRAPASAEENSKTGSFSCVVEPAAGPTVGLSVVSGATVSFVQVRLLVLELPTLSVALTENVCWPSARPGYALGEVHPAKRAPSMLHWKPARSITEAEKLKPGEGSFENPRGPAVMFANGAVLSTVHVRLAEEEMLPDQSADRTSKAYAPSAGGLKDIPEAHGWKEV